MIAVLLLISFLWANAQTNCTAYKDFSIGTGNIGSAKVTSAGECCNACNQNNACVAWTFDSDSGTTCYLKDNFLSNNTETGRTSGYRSTPLPAQDYIVEVVTSKFCNIVDDLYRSVTIDTTNNRQFFELDWSDPNIMYLFKELGPMYVRIGGSGEGQDHLQFDGTNCTKNDSCIDEYLFDQIYDLVVTNGKSRMVWGLPYTKYPNNTLDYSKGQEDLMKYASSKGYIIWGFELGNEDQSQVDDYPEIYASDFGVINTLVTKYWPNATIRPKLYGPDPQKNAEWGLQQFLMQVQKQKVPMIGITSHEYYGMNNEVYLNGQRLDSNFNTGYNWTGTLNQYYGGNNLDRTMQMWAGEIGPSIGGSGNCSDYYHRFNGFSDGFWYLDSLGSHAQVGYQVFCRQDFYGIDYAIIDCVGHFPVPDYYTAIIWNLVAGSHVFNTTRPITKPDASVRPYAHCSKQYPGGLTIMLINILSGTANVQITLTSGSLGNAREDYLLTAPPQNKTDDYPVPQNIYEKVVQLNGKTLNFTVGGKLPAIAPVQSTASDKSVITMPPYSYGFYVYPNANFAICKDAFYQA